MIRAGIPSVGVTSAPLPYEPLTDNPFRFETQTDFFILQHVRSIDGLGLELNKKQVQRSGDIEAMTVGSGVPKLKTITISATLYGKSISDVRDKYDALEMYIASPDCRWFGRGGYYYTLDVFDIKVALRIGGAANV
ncbi:MAG: hypothetical protein ACRCVX_15095, partial [Shewanella sp.]